MRAIKFRAWHEGNKAFEYFTLRDVWKNGFVCNEGWERVHSASDADHLAEVAFIPTSEPEQFIDIKANDHRDIYEGDIVRTSITHEGHRLPHMGEVVYSEYYGCFCTRNLGGDTPFYRHAINDREIRGNIHETPDLLK